MNSTYNLGRRLAGMATDSLYVAHRQGHRDILHELGPFHIAAHHSCRADKRTARYWAYDRSGLLAAAQADVNPAGGPITAHVTEFRSGTLVWTFAELPWAPEDAWRPHNGYRAIGRHRYYLQLGWQDRGRSPGEIWTLSTPGVNADHPQFSEIHSAVDYVMQHLEQAQ